MNGWIKLHRKLLDHWIWINEKYLRAWIWFLMRANHESNKILFGNELIEIKRGEFITSINNISLATELTSQNVRTLLRLLENDKMINKQSTNKLKNITIYNYDKYNVIQQANNKQPNKQPTSSQQAANKQATTDKNVLKTKKNEKNNIPAYEDFKNYALEKDKTIDLKALKNKYDSWIENDWKDGNDKKIINWKSKLLNVITYLPKIKKDGKFRNDNIKIYSNKIE